MIATLIDPGTGAGPVGEAPEPLALADAILDGSTAVADASAVRAAAVIARQVLEDAVERRCRELAGTLARPTGRCLLVADRGDRVLLVRSRWVQAPAGTRRAPTISSRKSRVSASVL